MSEWISVNEKETPDYSARKRGLPTMPINDRLYSKVVVNDWKCVSYMPEPPKEE